jgi:pimeloyl-ACP methyl ester carboxylesterase
MDAFARPGTASGLELLHARTQRDDACAAPLLFVHGAYVGAWCWAEHFLQHFADAGFESYALSLRGHGGSTGAESLSSHSIDDYVADVVEAVDAIGTPPVVIGHSMGGFVLQRLLARRELPAAVMMASVPPQGLGAASFELAWRDPSLLTELNGLLQGGRASPEALMRAMFATDIEPARLERYYRLTQRESQRAIWDMTFVSPFRSWPQHGVPVLYLAAEHDRLIPLHHQHVGAGMLRTTAEVMPGLGHGVMLEAEWMRVADRVIAWLRDVAP